MTGMYKGKDLIVGKRILPWFCFLLQLVSKGMTSVVFGAGSRGAEAELWPGVPARPLSYLG